MITFQELIDFALFDLYMDVHLINLKTDLTFLYTVEFRK